MNTRSAGRRGALRPTVLAAGIIAAFGLTTGVTNIASAHGAREGARHNPIALAPVARDAAQRPNRLQASKSRPKAGDRPTATIVVDNCNDAGAGSLRQALLDAVDGDVIDLTGLACSTITLTSGELSVAASVTINGPGRDALTISAGGATRVLVQSYGDELTIDGVTIADGFSTFGYGGCTWISGDLTLSNSRVTGCKAGDGTNDASYGAGLDVIGNLTLNNSIVSGNTSDALHASYGGGIYAGGDANVTYGSVVSGNIAIARNGYDSGSYTAARTRGGGIFARGNVVGKYGSVTDNRAQTANGVAYGGGVHANGGGVAFINSTISGNTVHSDARWTYGGGIQAGDDFGDVPGDILLVASTVSGNTASAGCGDCFIQGGGAHAFGSIAAKYSTIHDNTSELAESSAGTARGGGLATYAEEDEGAIQLLQSTISGNAAIARSGYSYGGGLAAMISHFIASGSTIAFNSAGTSGGGISASTYAYLGTGESTLVSTIVSDNSAPSGPDLAPYWPWGTLTVLGDHNLVATTTADVALPGDTINASAVLLPLASNGGPTATHALAPCSPALDAGSNPDTQEWDQRGDPFVREYGAGPDIGAFELQPNADIIFADGFDASPCTP